MELGRRARAGLERLVAAALLVAAPCSGCREPPPRRDSEAASAKADAVRLLEQARADVEREALAVRPRPSALYVPERLPSGGYPLLVFLHGLGGTGDGLARSLELRQAADAWGFAYLAPEGAKDYAGRQFWNADPSCCNFDRMEVDHVKLLRQWIDEALKLRTIDPERVFLIGYSNGGFMAHRAACDLAPQLRGIVSIAGAAPSAKAACRPSARLDVVQIHGDRDAIVAYEGGHLFADRRRPAHPSAEASLERWAKHDGCSGPLAPSRPLDLDPRLSGGETEVWSYGGCGPHRVELWRIRGGDHASGLSHDSLAAIWQFVRESRPLPQP